MVDTLIVTGAAGGMGSACARLLGPGRRVILTDVRERPLAAFSRELQDSGYDIVAAPAGPLEDDATLDAVVAATPSSQPFVLIHAAGLSPSLAEWDRIMITNLVSTEKLLARLDPHVIAGSVAVLIASGAGHIDVGGSQIDRLSSEPLKPDFLALIGAALDDLSGGDASAKAGLSYVCAKRAIIAMCERRAAQWAGVGARILSISPGTILTPMGRAELEHNDVARMATDAAPIKRPGTVMDIAFAARFLVSPEAGFITGCDLRVDGGGVGAGRAAGR